MLLDLPRFRLTRYLLHKMFRLAKEILHGWRNLRPQKLRHVLFIQILFELILITLFSRNGKNAARGIHETRDAVYL